MPRVVEVVCQQQSADLLSMREMRVDSFEQLRAATPTSRSEIIQVEAGRMVGSLKHATVGDVSLGFGSFSRGLISRGVYSDDRVTIGFLLEGRWDRGHGGRIGNVRVWAPGTEHERRHRGGASFGAISVSIDDLSCFFGQDSRFADPFTWRKSSTFSTDPAAGSAGASALRNIMCGFESRAATLTPNHAQFWKHAILEAATVAIIDTGPSLRSSSSGIRLVRKAQELIEGSGSAPVHLSALARSLRVSRSSLHRAFDDVLGVSPISYLRHRRLCEARIRLRDPNGPGTTVADVAFEQGFSDFGRFAGYYSSLFGEHPSETVRSVRRLSRLEAPFWPIRSNACAGPRPGAAAERLGGTGHLGGGKVAGRIAFGREDRLTNPS